MAAPHYYDGLYQHQPASESPNGALDQTQETTASNGDATTQSNTESADLSYRHNARGHSLNNPPPDGWVYPHKKGIGTGSNLEPFKADILARTERGENCKAIASALNSLGVQTSDRAISRVRIKWGMRKRAQRKVKTPPPGSEAARLSAKSRVQALRKSELIRMTKEGLSAEETCANLTNRGMELKKGVATVLRLQSAWGLAHDEKRWLGNFRHQCHKKAKAQQLEAFTEIAKELGLQDMEAWLRERMSQEPARQARHELALKLMGDHAPTNPERRKLQTPRRTDGPYDRPAHLTGDEELTDSDTSDSDSDSDADQTPAAKRPRSGLAGPDSRTAQGSYGNDVQSADFGDEHGMSMDHSSYLSDVNLDTEDNYTPLNDHEDDDMFVTEDDHDETNVVVYDTIPQRTTASRPVLKMWDPQKHYAEAARDSSANTVTPAKRGKGRSSKRSTAKTTPIPTTAAAATPPIQANLSHPHQAQPRSAMYPVPAAASGTTTAAFAIAPTTPAATTAVSPAPQLALRTEEAEANRTTLSTLDQYNVAAKVYKELLEARNENKPLPGSLTGLPPSAKEVDTAKRKLKEATQAMMLALD